MVSYCQIFDLYPYIFRVVEAFLEQTEAVHRNIETPLFSLLQKEVHAVTGHKLELLLWRVYFSAGSLRGVLFSSGVPIVVVLSYFNLGDD